MYQEAIVERNGTSSIRVEYELDIPEMLCPSSLDITELISVKRSEIFRVFLDDPVYTLQQSRLLTDWSYCNISPVVVGYLIPGNIVRILIGRVDSSDYLVKDYVTILHRIDSENYLSSHKDAYSISDEDILLLIHVSSIIEIPLTWPFNENLELAAASLSPPEENEENDGSLASQANYAFALARNEKTHVYNPDINFSITYKSIKWTNCD